MKIIHAVTRRPLPSVERPDAGVTSIEYGLVATAIALLVAAGVAGLGPKIIAVFEAIGTRG